MTREQIKMAKVHKHLISTGLIPLDRLCKMSIEELDNYPEAIGYIKSNVDNYKLFIAQYLLQMGKYKHTKNTDVKPSLPYSGPTGNLAEVAITDGELDAMDNVMMGVKGKSPL